jgi:hypothetical protein
MDEQGGRLAYAFASNDPLNRNDLFRVYDNCCCDTATVEKNKAALIDRCNAAAGYLNPSRPSPMPEEASWSCLSVALLIGKFMMPIPPCWTCYVEQRWADHATLTFVPKPYPHFERIIHDLNVVMCVSHPKSGAPEKVVFDYWHNAPAAEPYSAFTAKYPKPGSVYPTFQECDCTSRCKAWKPHYEYLEAIKHDL